MNRIKNYEGRLFIDVLTSGTFLTQRPSLNEFFRRTSLSQRLHISQDVPSWSSSTPQRGTSHMSRPVVLPDVIFLPSDNRPGRHFADVPCHINGRQIFVVLALR